MPPTTNPPATPAPPSTPTLVNRTYGEPRFHTEGDVSALAFHADGSLWSVDETGVLLHWSGEGHLLSRSFLSDLETLWAFSPDAKWLASGNDDLVLWEVETGQLVKRLEQPTWLTALAFSADGRTFAGGHDDGRVRIWDTATQKLIGEIEAHPQQISAIAFSPDASLIATAGEDRLVRIWDGLTHKPVAEFKSHTDRIPSLAWSADGGLLLSAGWDTSARVWKLGQTDPVILLNSHADQVLTLAFAPQGSLLAAADSDHEIYLWNDPATAKVGHVLRGHSDEIRCLTFNSDGSKLASAGADRVIHIWDTALGRLLAGPNPVGRNGVAVGITNGQEWVAGTGSNSLRRWDAATGEELPALPDSPDSPCSIAASADGRLLAVGGSDHLTRLYDLTQPGSAPQVLEATKPPIGSLAFHPKGESLAHTSPSDGLVWLWKTTGGEADLILIEAADGCTLETIAFHPNGRKVAVGGIDYLSTGDRDGAVCVWDLETKQKSATFDNGVYSVAFDPTGRYLAGAGIGDRVYLWDLNTNELVLDLDGHQERINAVAFNPDGSYLLSAGDDLTLRIWDVLSGRLLVVRGFDSAMQSLAFNAKGDMLYAGNANSTCSQIVFETLLND